MKIRLMQASLMLLVAQPMIAGIFFGNKKSGLVVSGSATLDLGTAQSLQGGMLRESGGFINAGSLECINMNFESTTQGEPKSFVMNGTVTIGSGGADEIKLESGDSLLVHGETITQPITAQSGVSALQGYGSFGSDITINPGATLVLTWDGPLSTNIVLTASETNETAVLELGSDIYLNPGNTIQASTAGLFYNTVKCNGHRLLLGGTGAPSQLAWVLYLFDPHIQLKGPIRTQECVLFLEGGPTYINGGGHLFIVNEFGIFVNEAEILDEEGAPTGSYYPVTFEDIIFRDVWCGFFQGGDHWNFINTTCESGLLSLTINGTLLGSQPSPLSGETHFGASSLVINTDLNSSSGTWIFEEDSVLDCCGNSIDMSIWHFDIQSGKQLTIRNACLKSVSAESFVGAGTVRLSNVTFALDAADVDLTAGPLFVIDGPVTCVTGPYTLTVATGSSINNTTLWYDTSASGDAGNIIGFDITQGRVQHVGTDISPSVNTVITENTVLDTDVWLYPRIVGALSSTLHFAQSGSDIVYNGRGHRIMLPFITEDILANGGSSHVIFVGQESATTVVVMENLVLDGFKNSLFSYNTADSAICFGNNTVINLQEDLVDTAALARDLIFGTGIPDRYEVMTLDLRNHSLDCDEFQIVVEGNTTDVALRIKNGRILKPSFNHENTKIILDSVELVLLADTTFSGAAIDIEGNCRLSGNSDAIFRWVSSGAFTIKSGATLCISDGVTFFHDNSQGDTFIFEDATAKLELIGGKFQRKVFESEQAPLVLTKGLIIIDHTACMNVGDQNIQLGNGESAQDVSIEIRPGATLRVTGTGSLVYSNTH